MIRDLSGAIVRTDERRMRKRLGRPNTATHNPRPKPKRHTCSLWPRVVWASCRSCRQTYRAAPRGGSQQSSHDPHLCAYRRDRYGV